MVSSEEDRLLSPGGRSVEAEGGKRIRWMKGLAVFFTLFLVFSLLDIVIYLYSDKDFRIESSALKLESETADAEMEMLAHVNLNSYLHSFNVKGGECEYYCTDSLGEKNLVTTVFGHVNKRSREKNLVEASFLLKDTNFVKLRRFLWDFHTGEETISSVSCASRVSVNIFKAIEINLDITTSGVLDNKLIFHDEFASTVDEQQSLFDILGKTYSFFSETFTLEDFTDTSMTVKASNAISAIQNFPFPIKSFVVHVPELSYKLNTVGKYEDLDSTLVLSSSSCSMELGEAAEGADAPFLSFLTAQCSSVASDGKVIETQSCSLFNALHAEKWYDELKKGIIFVEANSTKHNFISKVLGENHFLSASAYPVDNRRRLQNDQLSPRDPDVSEGSECILVDGDNVYDSVACYVVEKGFTKTYLDIYDEDGAVGIFKGTTGWAVTGGFAFDSQYVAMLRGNYVAQGNMTASEDFRNASMLVVYSEDAVEKVRTNAFTTWETSSRGGPSADVSYSIRFEEYFENPGNFNSSGSFSFGDGQYVLHGKQDVNMNGADWQGYGFAEGQYGGGAFNWLFSVDSSEFFVDNQLEGTMTALLSTDIATDGEAGDVVVQCNVLDGSNDEELYTNNLFKWGSNTKWQEDGNIIADSLFRCVDVDWDIHDYLKYGANKYVSEILHLEKSGSERLYGIANGTFSGGWNSWQFTVGYSELRVQGDEKGTATMLLSSDVYNGGSTGDIVLEADAKNEYSENILQTFNEGSWSSDSGSWSDTGNIALLSVMQIEGVTNWNSDNKFVFDNGKYSMNLTNYDLSDTENFLCFAYGNYGGTFYDWHASVDHSEVRVGGVDKGGMECSASSFITGEGKYGDVLFGVNVYKASGSELFYTQNEFHWNGDTSNLHSWVEEGSLVLSSVLRVQGSEVSWDVDDSFWYDRGFYELSLLNADGGGDQRWLVFGNGTYKGQFDDWIVTLDYSELWLQGDNKGKLVGVMSLQSMEIGNVYVYSEAFDNVGVLQLLCNTSASWLTETSWADNGLIKFDSFLNYPDCQSCQASTWVIKDSLSYGSNSYTLSLQNSEVEGSERLYLNAVGSYEGDSFDWWVSLEDSSLWVGGEYYGKAQGFASSAIPASFSMGNIDLYVRAEDSSEVEVVYLNVTCDWSTASSWEKSGNIDYSISLRVTNVGGNYFMGTPFVVYGSDEGQVYESEMIYGCPGDSLTVSLCADTATCAGDTLVSLYRNGELLEQDDDECGFCSSVKYSVPSDWASCSDIEIRYGCYGLDVCSGSAAINQQSFPGEETKPPSYFIDFNRYRRLSYGDGSYSYETKSYQSNGQEVVYIITYGSYGGTLQDFYVTLDYGELRTLGIKRLDSSGVLESEVVNDGEKAQIAFTLLCNAPNSETGVDTQALRTENLLSWDGFDADKITAAVFTNTSVSSSPQYMMKSSLFVDEIKQQALFLFLDDVLGEEYSSLNATAWYDTATGMMTGIDMFYLFQTKPKFNAHFFLNAQEETLSLPTAEPTISPTAEGETLSPSLQPTVYIPTVTVVSYLTSTALDGVTAADMDDGAQMAFLNVTAASLSGVSVDDLQIITMTNKESGRRLQARRQLSSSVEIEFSTTVGLEESGYSSSVQLAQEHNAQLTAAYSDPNFGNEFTNECQNFGSNTINDNNVVTFEDPVVDESSITETVVKSWEPTASPTSLGADTTNNSSSDTDETVIIASIAVGLFVLAAVAMVLYCYAVKKICSKKSEAQDEIDPNVEKKNVTQNPLKPHVEKTPSATGALDAI